MKANLTEVLNAKPGLRHVHPQIIRDALYCFSKFDVACVEFLRDNAHRLTRHTYMDEEGNGCIFGLLSEPLPEKERIRDRSALTTWFTGGCGYLFRERPEYQPARYLVRVWDGDRDPGTEERYECWRGHLTKQNIRDLAEIYLELRSRRNMKDAVAVATTLAVAR
ncbi:MAG: hypothetical protein ACOYMN_15315 [Roseimicrobium sp.]